MQMLCTEQYNIIVFSGITKASISLIKVLNFSLIYTKVVFLMPRFGLAL